MKRDDLGLQIERSLEGLQPKPISAEAIGSRAARRRTRRRGVMAGAAILVLLAVVTIGLAGRPSSGPLAPLTVEASARVPLSGKVISTASDGDHLWVLTCSAYCAGSPFERTSRGSLIKVDSRLGTVVAATSVVNPHLVAVGEGAVWTVAFPDGVVTKIDPTSLDAVASTQLSLPRPIAPDAADAMAFLPSGIAVGEGAVWVSTARGYLAEIDPEAVERRRIIALPYSPAGIAIAGGQLWLSAGPLGVGGVDPESAILSPPQPIQGSRGDRLSADYLTATEGSLWVRGAWIRSGEGDENEPGQEGEAVGLLRLDPHGGQVLEEVGFDPFLTISAVSGSHLWLSGHELPQGTEAIYTLRPGTGTVELVARLAEPGVVIGAVENDLWVARPNDYLQRYEMPVKGGD